MGPITKMLFNEVHSFIYLYKEKPFQLSSGKFSNYYFNCKKILMNPKYLSLVVQAICEELIPKNHIPVPEAVGGLTLGADPLSYAISLYYWNQGILCYPCVVRKETKEHGIQKRIEGELENFKEVIVVDDVITTGASTLKAVQAFREEGKIVRYSICIIDREEEGKEELLRNHIQVFSLWKKSDFIN